MHADEAMARAEACRDAADQNGYVFELLPSLQQSWNPKMVPRKTNMYSAFLHFHDCCIYAYQWIDSIFTFASCLYGSRHS